MGFLFDPENRFWSFLNKIYDAMFIGILWLLFSLPVITIGAATTASYYFTLRQVNDTEGGVWKSFTAIFLRRFKKATLIWLIQLAAGIFLTYDLWISWQMSDWSSGISPIKLILLGLVCITLMYIGTSIYLYPILALFDFGVKKVISNAFIMAMANLPSTITITLLFFLAGVGVCYIPLFLPFFYGLAVFLSSHILFNVFERYTIDEE